MDIISPAHLAEHNQSRISALEDDYDHLGRQLARRGIDIAAATTRATRFRVALPSWGTSTGGTRFGRFPGPGEPRTIFDKIDDCAVVQQLVRVTPDISLHIPWDRIDRPADLRACVAARGLQVTTMNSNTFEDQPGQPHSYKFGSLSHTDPAVRQQAVAHNIECIGIGRELGARAHSVWIADGGNFPGQQHFRRALDRYLDSLRAIYAAAPADWRLYIEHSLVRLNLIQRLALFCRLPLLDEPLHDPSFVHRFAQNGQDHFSDHKPSFSYSTPRMAATICSVLGMAAASNVSAIGTGTSAAATRTGGESR